MGGIVSNFMSLLPKPARKRRYSSDEEDEVGEKLLLPRKRGKRNATPASRVIYEELFKAGSYSDIKIVVCGHEWNLHKPILKQCPYFEVMLTGPWLEAKQDIIHIELVDPNITREAIDFVFGTLYCNDLSICKENVVGLVAAASHFQMESLVNRCGEIMKESLTNYNIMKYYTVAQQYGVPHVKEHVFVFLLRNIVCNKYFWPILHQISVELMARLIDSAELLVNHSEYNVYRLLLRWLYSHVHSAANHCSNKEIAEYFKNLPGTCDFLSTEEGEKYQNAFRKLRLRHILITTQLIHHLRKSRVIPQQWITEALCHNYLETLRVHEGHDRGATENQKEELDARGIRFGRTINRAESSWRWHMALAGLDLCWSLKDNALHVWRTKQNDVPLLTNTLIERHILVRVRFIPVSLKKAPSVQSDILCLPLPINIKVEVVKVPEKLKFPAVLCLELLLTSNDASLSDE